MSTEETRTSGNKLRIKEAQRRKRMALRLPLALLALMVGCGLGWYLLTLPMSTGERPIRLTIPPHSSAFAIGKTLQREGVVRNALAFALSAHLNGKGGALKAGHYRFIGELPLEKVIDRLQAGPNDTDADLVKVTIPEGYTLEQIAALLEQKGIVEKTAFLQGTTHPDTLSGLTAEFPLPKGSLEGYLFPDTYELHPRSAPLQVVNAMLMNFSKRFYRPYQQEIEAQSGGLPDIVTKASLIEREAKVEQDRPRIAGVIDNRLQAGMKLQIDASVLYGRAHKSRVMDSDLKRESPYNTYLYAGLPPGPIANPGMSCLLAALHPERNSYLYYVARPDGTHLFTRTFSEHEAAVKQARAEWKQQGRDARDE